MAARSLRRPYRVPLAMPLLFALIPLYIFIPELFPPAARSTPELGVDRLLPLVPGWSLVYGALYLFLIVLPILIVREEELLRRTVHAYLLIWITAYLFFFVLYPTSAPRPPRVIGEGFGVWALGALYSADPPYNCFPSLHVAHSFVSAFASRRVHRGVGNAAMICAALVAVSTLFTKQHWVADVIAGVVLALIAHALFLARYPAGRMPGTDRDVAPALAAVVAALVLLGVIGSWVVYLGLGETRFDFGP